jgi:hypothetical protein
MGSKLTLSVDPTVVARAKRWAARRGESLSSLVEQYLDVVTRTVAPAVKDQDTPALRALRGSLKGAGDGVAEHRRHLDRKYR